MWNSLPMAYIPGERWRVAGKLRLGFGSDQKAFRLNGSRLAMTVMSWSWLTTTRDWVITPFPFIRNIPYTSPTTTVDGILAWQLLSFFNHGGVTVLFRTDEQQAQSMCNIQQFSLIQKKSVKICKIFKTSKVKHQKVRPWELGFLLSTSIRSLGRLLFDSFLGVFFFDFLLFLGGENHWGLFFRSFPHWLFDTDQGQ